MLITKEVEIKVNACVVPYFRGLGYITGKDKMLVVPVGFIIFILEVLISLHFVHFNKYLYFILLNFW